MTTSGSYDFNLTRNQIIEEALIKVGGLSFGQTPTPEQYSSASKTLNMIVNNWRAEEIFLWTLDWVTIPFVASSTVLGTDGVDYECIRNHTSSADNRPVTGADYKSFWRQLDTTVGPPWVTATAYTSICNYALPDYTVAVTDLRVRYASDPVSTAYLLPMTREEYVRLTNNTVEGLPTQYFFFRQDTPSLFFYPYPDNVNYTVEAFLYQYPQDLDVPGNTSDLLKEWLLPMVNTLAYQIAPGYGVFEAQLADLKKQADDAKAVAKKLDHEFGDVLFVPSPGGFR